MLINVALIFFEFAIVLDILVVVISILDLKKYRKNNIFDKLCDEVINISKFFVVTGCVLGIINSIVN